MAPKRAPMTTATVDDVGNGPLPPNKAGLKAWFNHFAFAQRAKREAEEKEAKKMEWGKGLVQRDDQDKRKKELEDMKNAPFARTADDTAMNEELRAKELWNDPAAAFLTVSCLGPFEHHIG